jgi:hypothetical protein
MAKHVTLGEGMEALPVYIRRAHGHDRTWREQAQCAKPNVVTEWLGQPPLRERDEEIQRRRVWNIDTTGPREVQLLGIKVEAAEVEALACLICNSCPAQYDCAIYAIKARESAGTWAMRNDWLRVLQARGEDEAIAFVEQARTDGVKIQGRVKRRLLARGNTPG